MITLLNAMMFGIKVLLTLIYVLAICFAEFDRKKWWCYVVMIASIYFVWR